MSRTCSTSTFQTLDWGTSYIGADSSSTQSGNNAGSVTGVKVFVIDTGIDPDHTDLNVVTGINYGNQLVDSTHWEDEHGHGTHVAGIIGAADNGFGLTGVAPGVSLVELKGGQDSGYFFLEPVVNALIYAANAGVDVINMSFYVDPWLYNCTANPADSPAAQAEQRMIIAAVSRALTYAHRVGTSVDTASASWHAAGGSGGNGLG